MVACPLEGLVGLAGPPLSEYRNAVEIRITSE